MTRESYTTKNGVTQYRPVMTTDEMSRAMFDGGQGFCLSCGLETDGVEPDARRYRCDGCGFFKVYGLEELLMMGLITFVDETEQAVRPDGSSLK